MCFVAAQIRVSYFLLPFFLPSLPTVRYYV